MGLKETLSLLITADSSGAIKALEGVGHEADKSLGKTEDRIAAVGKKMQSVGAGMVASGGLLVAGFAAAAMASEEADKSVLKLENSINGNAKIAQGASAEFQDLAKAIQSKTAADADTIVSGQAVLVQMGATTEQVKELTPLAVDLAQKMGIDMDTAFKMVGKAIDGSAGALKKAGISVDETKFKTDAYAATVEALTASVGGFAEEEGATFAGSLERIKNQLGDVEEAVGKGAAEAFTQMLGPVSSVVGALSDLDPQLLATVGHMGAFAAVGVTAGGGIAMTVGRMLELNKVLGNGEGGMSKYGKAVVGIGVALGVAGLATTAWSQRAGTLSIDLSKMGDITDAALDKMIKFSSTVGAAAAGGMKQFGEQMAQSSIPGAQRYAEAMARAGIATDEFTAGIGGVVTSQAKMKIATADASEQVSAEANMLEGKASPSMITYGDATAAAEKAQRGLGDAIKAATDPFFGALDAMNQNRAASEALYNAQATLATAIREHGARSAEAAQATRDLEEAQLSSAKTAGDVQVSMNALAEGIKNGTISIGMAESTLAAWVTQGLITQGTADGIIAKFGGMAGAAAALDGSTTTMKLDLDTQAATAKFNAFIASISGPLTSLEFSAAALGLDQPPGYNFDGGGMVPGPRGAPLVAVVHGGEQVLTPAQQAAGGGNIYLTVNAGLGTDGPTLGRQLVGYIEQAAATGVRPGVRTRAAFRS